MNWLLLVLFATFLDAIRIFIDNYISDTFFKGKLAASQKCLVAIGDILVAIILMAVISFNFGQTEPYIYLITIFAGALYTLGGIPYYKALEIEESTNLGIFVQLAPILYLVLGWAFLGESFSLYQLIAIPVILLAPLIIVLNARKRSRKIKIRAVIYAFLYILFAVIGNLIFVKTNALETNHLGFIGEIAFFYLGMGISNVAIVICMPKWRKRFTSVTKKYKSKLIVPLSINFIFSVIKSVAYRAGLILAPTVALASAASDSAEPIVIFFLGILLTLIWPKFGREKLDRKSIIVHLIATFLVVLGIVLLQM
ncbi:EamA family transporter [Candidatus Saccharibacteria bacterium]|nr:EamA family transporter [Candidatus Saccharibacteria bacterium]